MLLYITMKSPDTVYEAQKEAALAGAEEEMEAVLFKYFEYKEYCLLEFNTETGESRVVPNSEQDE